MPIHEIRESIEVEEIVADSNGFAIIQKVINLKDNVSHKMIQCDAYLDNPFPIDNDGQGFIAELLVTPTPVIYTDMLIATYPSRAPSASNDNILFKQTINPSGGGPVEREFPNKFISARPTFTWYMPKIYLTLFIHTTPNNTINNWAQSVYMAVEHKKASLITYAMGVIREDHQAQVANVMAQGRSIPPFRNVGQSFPMWKYGGVRPELMISGSSLSNFFNRSASNEEQNTLTPTELRTFAKQARQMQPNLDAFGTAVTPQGAVPDWVRFTLFKGVESGAIREQWPPTKYADNGNTLTL